MATLPLLPMEAAACMGHTQYSHEDFFAECPKISKMKSSCPGNNKILFKKINPMFASSAFFCLGGFIFTGYNPHHSPKKDMRTDE